MAVSHAGQLCPMHQSDSSKIIRKQPLPTQQRSMVHPAHADGRVCVCDCDLVHPHVGRICKGNGIVAAVGGVVAVGQGAARQRGGNTRSY